MKRVTIIVALLGAMLVSLAATPAAGQVFVYRRPFVAPRPAYTYGYYYRPWTYYDGPRAYYGRDYYGPSDVYYYGPRVYPNYGPQVYRPSQVYRPYWGPGYWR